MGPFGRKWTHRRWYAFEEGIVTPDSLLYFCSLRSFFISTCSWYAELPPPRLQSTSKPRKPGFKPSDFETNSFPHFKLNCLRYLVTEMVNWLILEDWGSQKKEGGVREGWLWAGSPSSLWTHLEYLSGDPETKAKDFVFLTALCREAEPKPSHLRCPAIETHTTYGSMGSCLLWDGEN